MLSSLELDLFKAWPSGGLIPRHLFSCKIPLEIGSEINLDLVHHLLFPTDYPKVIDLRRDACRCLEGVL